MEAVRSTDIVFSLAGHDKGKAFIVLKIDGSHAFLVDGKTRKLNNPKRKSLKHICLGKKGSQGLEDALIEGNATDSLIRRELARFRNEAVMTEEGKQIVKR